MIRPMEARDAKALAALDEATFSDPWSEEAFLAAKDFGKEILVAEEAGEVCGYIMVRIVADEGELLSLAVSKAHRKAGWGAALLDEGIVLSRSHGAKTMDLEVRASNVGAIHLYASRGFLQVGHRKDYYDAPKEDALLYRKELL